ncbi:MAG: multinuclear nonheme iron-dependent oxidase, partial [Aeromonas veronii]
MRPISSRSRGIGLRQEHLDALCSGPVRPGIDFLELAPENWMAIGGARREQLHRIAERYPLVAHGLSLSLGDCQPLNRTLLSQIRTFLDEFGIEIYSEHLSFSRDQQGYLYELLPVPRQWENIPYLAERIAQVQEALARPLVLENISYYHGYDHEMPEEDFLAELVARSGC